MGDSMKPVSSDFVVLIIFHRQRIQIMCRLHTLMESCIEDSNLSNLRKQLLAGKDSLKIGRIMQWCQISAFLDHINHLISDNHRILEIFFSMHHPMPYCIKFEFSIDRQCRQNGMQRILVILYFRTILSDFLDVSFRYDDILFHIEELIFQGRTSRIED